MVHDVVYLVGGELVEDGYCYCSVGECCEERYRPVGAVASAEGYLVAFLHTTVLEHDVQFLYLASHVVILQCGSFVVSESIKVPVVDNAFLNQCVKTWYLIHNVICTSIVLYSFLVFWRSLPVVSGRTVSCYMLAVWR